MDSLRHVAAVSTLRLSYSRVSDASQIVNDPEDNLANKSWNPIDVPEGGRCADPVATGLSIGRLLTIMSTISLL
jgi:hypothetical protein